MLFKPVLASLAALPAALAAAGQLVRITENFGPNPNGVLFYLYAPPKLQARPPILVIPHYCTGTAQAVFGGTQQLVSAADTYGFIIIYPEANRSGKCWDLSSAATLKHDAGGDSLGIASAVRWTLTKYNANPSRVFSYGGSSGAMMTNVLMGAYPDLFAGGSAWAGVPFGCYGDVGGTATWSSNCAQGKRIMTGAQWKALVDAAYPGYAGWRPKMQTVHGDRDETVNFQNWQEQIKQWTSVLGTSTNPIQTINNAPYANWITYIYGDKFQAIKAPGATHNLPNDHNTILNFFDLKCVGTTSCFGRPSGSATTTQTTATPAPGTTSMRTTTTTTRGGSLGPVQTKWGQCGGQGWTGPTVCESGTTCTYSNDWYSQCI